MMKRDFEFAQKYGLRLREVIAPAAGGEETALPYTAEEDAVLINSGEWSGLGCVQAQAKMAAFAKRMDWYAYGYISSEGLGE